MISAHNPQSEFLYAKKRCYATEIYNRESDDACSIVRARVTPGVTTRLQRLVGVVERYVILQGE